MRAGIVIRSHQDIVKHYPVDINECTTSDRDSDYYPDPVDLQRYKVLAKHANTPRHKPSASMTPNQLFLGFSDFEDDAPRAPVVEEVVPMDLIRNAPMAEKPRQQKRLPQTAHERLNADDSFPNMSTKDLVDIIKLEIRRLGIPQVVFAEKLLKKTQGTLSDLLNRPKPWAELKHGKEVYLKMFRWARLSEKDKYAILGWRAPEKKASRAKKHSVRPKNKNGGQKRHMDDSQENDEPENYWRGPEAVQKQEKYDDNCSNRVRGTLEPMEFN